MFHSKKGGLCIFVTVCTVLLGSSHGQQGSWEECSKHLFAKDPVGCLDIEKYVKCTIRALGPNTEGVDEMADTINNNIREGNHQAFLECDLDAHHLMEEVRREEGWPVPGPEARGGSREEDDDDDRHHNNHNMNTAQLPSSFGGQNAQNDACVERFMEDVVGVKDRDHFCEPTKDLMLCMFKAMGIDLTDHMSRYEKDYIEQMMSRELRQLGVNCDFTLDSLIQQEKENFSYTTKILTPMVGVLFVFLFLTILGRVYIVRRRRMAMRGGRGRAGPYTVSNSNSLHTSGASPGVGYPPHPTGPQQHLPAYDAPYTPQYANSPPALPTGPPAYASAPPTYELAMESKNASLEGGVNPIYDTIHEKH